MVVVVAECCGDGDFAILSSSFVRTGRFTVSLRLRRSPLRKAIGSAGGVAGELKSTPPRENSVFLQRCCYGPFLRYFEALA